jgi:hypothetical protein
METVHRIRVLLHRRYVRAVVLALALIAAAGALGTIAVELRFSVPAGAVVRYFARLHSSSDDLTPLLRQPATLGALRHLSHGGPGMNAGGLVYSDEGGLRFYPWMPLDEAAAAELRTREHQAVYSQLLPKYFSAEVDGLIADLSHPETRRQLGRLGVSSHAVEELRRGASAELTPDRHMYLLRQAARLIRLFMPRSADRHRLELADKLRFYAVEAPRGRYIGLYEVRGASWLSPAEPDPLPDAGRLLVITKEVDGRIMVDDLRPSRRRTYQLTPVPHPAGLPLYRIISQA